MKVYTQEDFEAILRDADGYKQCPAGDYSNVSFKSKNKLVFGDECKFGRWCELGTGCKFGDECEFGTGCKFGDECEFGRWCELGTGCKFGDGCKFGTGCKMGSGRVANATFFEVSNIGSRNDTAYFCCDTKTGEMYVRAGCWFSELSEFVDRVKEVHAGTEHEVDYLAAVAFANARFARYKRP